MVIVEKGGNGSADKRVECLIQEGDIVEKSTCATRP